MRNHVQVPVEKQDLNIRLSEKECDALHSTEEQQCILLRQRVNRSLMVNVAVVYQHLMAKVHLIISCMEDGLRESLLWRLTEDSHWGWGLHRKEHTITVLG